MTENYRHTMYMSVPQRCVVGNADDWVLVPLDDYISFCDRYDSAIEACEAALNYLDFVMANAEELSTAIVLGATTNGQRIEAAIRKARGEADDASATRG